MPVRKTNKDRSDNMYRLILVFLRYYGYEQSEADQDDYYIRDLLCDLMHFCDEFAIDFQEQLRIGEAFYDEEVEEKISIKEITEIFYDKETKEDVANG